MASTTKHIRSSTADKRPTTAIADGQLAVNTNATSPGLFFKDSAGSTIIKVGPVHVGSTAPNATPAGSAGNSTGEIWLDNGITPVGVKIWDGSAWVNATPAGSTTVQGLLELATNAETQTGVDTARAVTPASLQSKLSDSTSTTSSTTIASSTAVKSAYDLAAAALPKAGGTVTGSVTFGTSASLSFEGATDDSFETSFAFVDPTADRTITFPNISGTVVTTADSGTVTSTMIADGTIVNADINASAAIGLSKLATGALPTGITIASANIVDGTIVNADINASAAIDYSKLASLTAGNIVLGNASNVATSTAVTGDVTIDSSGVTAIASGVIVNADINASAAIADTKLGTISTAGKVSGTAITSGNISTSGSFATTSTVAVGQASAAANTDFDVNGTYAQTVVAVSVLDIDCSTGNYFTKTIAANSTFTVSNVPASRAYAFTLEITHTSGTITWFSGVEWPAGTAPTLTTGKTHLFMFVTDDGGTRWRASSLVDYTN